MYDGVVQNLIDELGRLPGVGPKGAQRIAFYLLGADRADVRRLAALLVEVTEQIRFCRVCGNVAVDEECRICQDPRRDPSVICVVEEPKDVAGIEKIREFRGRYHVLWCDQSHRRDRAGGPADQGTHGGAIRRQLTELILATDPNLGEATATYLAWFVATGAARDQAYQWARSEGTWNTDEVISGRVRRRRPFDV